MATNQNVKVVGIDGGSFDSKRERGAVALHTVYAVTSVGGSKMFPVYSTSYGWTPDGTGFYWFDTEREAVEAMGW